MNTRRSESASRPPVHPATGQPLKPRHGAVFDRDYAMALVALRPGISDREIAQSVYGPGTPSQVVTPICRELATEGVIRRRLRADGLLGNYLRED